MRWEYAINLYVEKFCMVRGLASRTQAAYARTLMMFAQYAVKKERIAPEEVTSNDIIDYIEYLRKERGNGNSAVNRAVTIVKNFYSALVAMDYLDPRLDPSRSLPKLKAPLVKVVDVLEAEEVTQLVNMPADDTVLGVRDRAILALLYGTGIRASECEGLKNKDVDLVGMRITVTGKGGSQRTLPLHDTVAGILKTYKKARGKGVPLSPFFKSRKKGGRLKRGGIYYVVKKYARKLNLPKRVTPHTLRHTFATHLCKLKVNIAVLKELLGHRLLTSTQRYLNISGEALREVINNHPIKRLVDIVAYILPKGRMPFQYPPGTRFSIGT
jgi:site-specific recombinase XerD